MESLTPIQRLLLLADGTTNMHVTCFSFLDQSQCLLDNLWLMTQENCLFFFANTCAILVNTGARDDLDQSRFWYEAQRGEGTSISDVLAP